VVIAQVAVTVLFPVSVFFILRAQDSIQSFDVGFASEQFLSARLEPDAAGEAGKAYEALDRRLSAEGLVSGVTFASRLPGDFHFPRGIEVVDSTESPRFTVNAAAVAVDFFDVLGADLLAGRTFNATDEEPGHQVIVVNKAFVERILHGRNAIGRRLRLMQQPDATFEIVGVVENLGMNYLGRGGAEGFYLPLSSQTADPVFMVARIRGEPTSFAPRLQAIAGAVDSTLRLYQLRPMNEMHAGVLKMFAIFIRVALVVSSVALLLSLVSIYAVMSFAVSRRTREIGIRVALGADAGRIVDAVFRRPLAQVALGVAIGGLLVAQVAAIAIGGLSSGEVGLVVAYACLMLVVCLFACIVPTRRALSIQPTEALRQNA
jgi:putative ABC transport system permease protein